MPAVIVGYARSPFTPAKKGALARTRPDDIAAVVVNQLISDVGIARSIVEDLIVAAHNDAKSKLKKKTSEEISKVTGGISLPPGFKLPF